MGENPARLCCRRRTDAVIYTGAPTSRWTDGRTIVLRASAVFRGNRYAAGSVRSDKRGFVRAFIRRD